MSDKIILFLSQTMQQLKTMIPMDANIKDAYNTGSDEEQNFVQNLSLFLCTFLKEHGTLVEKKPEMQVLYSQILGQMCECAAALA